MLVRSKLLLLVTLGAIALASFAPPMPSAQEPGRPHPVGCHQHGQTPSSSPVPVDYRCCVAGHQQALLPGSFVLQPFVAIRTGIEAAHGQVVSPMVDLSSPVKPPGGPPGIAILRI